MKYTEGWAELHAETCNPVIHVHMLLTLLSTGSSLNNLWHLKTSWSNSSHTDVVKHFKTTWDRKTQQNPSTAHVWTSKANVDIIYDLLLTHFLNHQTVRSSRIWAVTFISNASWEQILARSVKGSEDLNAYSQAAKLSSYFQQKKDRKASARFEDSNDWCESGKG